MLVSKYEKWTRPFVQIVYTNVKYKVYNQKN